MKRRMIACAQLGVPRGSWACTPVGGILLTQICHELSAHEKKEVIRLAVELQRSEDEENQLISIQLIAKTTPDMATEEAEAFFKK